MGGGGGGKGFSWGIMKKVKWVIVLLILYGGNSSWHATAIGTMNLICISFAYTKIAV